VPSAGSVELEGLEKVGAIAEHVFAQVFFLYGLSIWSRLQLQCSQVYSECAPCPISTMWHVRTRETRGLHCAAVHSLHITRPREY
jgi:hypothetical protein